MELKSRLDIIVVSDVVRRRKLKWCGHLERMSESVTGCLIRENWKLLKLNGK